MSPGDVPVLVDLEILGDDDELRAAAAELPVVEASATGRYEAADPTRMIRVTVDRQALLADVEIVQDWQNRLEPSLFAETLFTTYLRAVQSAFVGERSSGPAPAEPEAEPDSSTWEAGVRAELARNDEIVRSLRQVQADDSVTEIRGLEGYLTLRLRGGSAEEIIADPEVLAYANPARLRADALAVFDEAGLAVEVDLDADLDDWE